jgi:hypothetical protein
VAYIIKIIIVNDAYRVVMSDVKIWSVSLGVLSINLYFNAMKFSKLYESIHLCQLKVDIIA